MLYQLVFRGAISRATLAYANEHRDWRIYADFAQLLIRIARDPYHDEPSAVELDQTVFDSTKIDLCWSLFSWAQFSRQKSQNPHAARPAWQHFDQCLCNRREVHDINLLDELVLEAGACYLLDRGYLDYPCLPVFTQARAFFIARAKQNTQFHRCVSRAVDRSTGLRSDHPAQRAANGLIVSRSSAPHSLLRRRERLAPDFSHQQFPPASFDHRATLSGSL